MVLPTITKADVDEWRACLKQHQPYENYDTLPYDGESDPLREQATKALSLLNAYGLDPYDDNDYGDILERKE